MQNKSHTATASDHAAESGRADFNHRLASTCDDLEIKSEESKRWSEGDEFAHIHSAAPSPLVPAAAGCRRDQ